MFSSWHLFLVESLRLCQQGNEWCRVGVEREDDGGKQRPGAGSRGACALNRTDVNVYIGAVA
jgi:hypothetical protein